MSIEEDSYLKIKNKIKTAVNEISQLKEMILVKEDELNKKRKELKNLIPDVIEIQKIANQRNDILYEKRKLERKILSLYYRFPTILEADEAHVMATDITILKNQLDSMNKREEIARKQIRFLDQKINNLEKKIVDLQKSFREEMNMYTKREEEILNNSKGLNIDETQELYSHKIDEIDEKVIYSKQLIQMYKSKLNGAKTHYNILLDCCKNIQYQIIFDKHNEIINKTNDYIKWWGDRRINQKYFDIQEELSKLLLSVKKCYENEIQQFDKLKKKRIMNENELKSFQEMNNLILLSIDKKKNIIKENKEEIKECKASYRNSKLPDEIKNQLIDTRNRYKLVKNKNKSLLIEIKLYSNELFVQERDERNYKEALFEYQKQMIKKSILKKKIKQLKIKEPETNKTELLKINDPKILLSESAPIRVLAGSLELLVKLLFESSNKDELYKFSFIVLTYSEEIDLSLICKMILTEYKISDTKTRNEDLRNLLSLWDKWFLRGYQTIPNELKPLYDCISLSKTDNGNKLDKYDFTFDDSVPYNQTENLLFSTSPTILAVHFTYHDITMLNKISANEFIKCGWTSPDKWNKSPNITGITDYFNTTSQYVVASIVLGYSHETRVEILERWIQIMKASYELNNYQFIFLIYSSLCNPAVRNLTKLWQSISDESQDDFDFFTNLTSASNRFENYRNNIEGLPYDVICPYIGPQLTQLIYINDGNPSKKNIHDVQEPVLNFQKFRMFSEVMLEILKPWGKNIKFVLNKDLLSNIESIPPIEQTQSEIFQISQNIANNGN